MKNLWNGGNEKTKLKFVKTLIFPIATYGSETWSLSNAAEQKINAFEMRSYRKLLKVQWTEKRTNDSIRKQLGNIPENWLLDTILRRKLAYFGHIKRHDCLEKQIFEGIVEGKRGRGRPKRIWSQDVSDRLHTTVAEAGRRALSRDAFRRAVRDATCHAAKHLLHELQLVQSKGTREYK